MTMGLPFGQLITFGDYTFDVFSNYNSTHGQELENSFVQTPNSIYPLDRLGEAPAPYKEPSLIFQFAMHCDEGSDTPLLEVETKYNDWWAHNRGIDGDGASKQVGLLTMADATGNLHTCRARYQGHLLQRGPENSQFIIFTIGFVQLTDFD